MIHFIPLENIEERYTVLMNTIVNKSKAVKVYYPEWQSTQINKGQFLDIERTIEFKAKQVEMISQAFQRGMVSDGDWFFVADIFFPALDSIKYMAELQDINIKVAAFNHAGRADQADFVQKLGTWSDTIEKGYHELCDLIFVGSEYHKQKVVDYFGLDTKKVLSTGCIWSNKEAFKYHAKYNLKKDFVIFPHRLSPEKGVDDFLEIAKAMPEKEFVITSSSNKECGYELPDNVKYVNNLKKGDYYAYLSSAKYYLSTAYQETFGYTLREALLYNCRVVVPNDLCYPEMLPKKCLYERGDLTTIKKHLSDNYKITDRYINKYDNNFQEMIKHLK